MERPQVPLNRACAADVSRFCADVAPGSGRVISCLGEHKGNKGMGEGCRVKLHEYQERVLSDFRLDSRLLQVTPYNAM